MDPEIPPGYLSLGDWDLKPILECSRTLPLLVVVMDGTCEVFVPVECEDQALQALEAARD
ncbi:hypothetical protein [Deinococcus roseus]|uniref:Uncharacterized protein n=1 Tax=Deinococcus roseus TaxID=392414 RepID=A0ABQ2DEX2_9DEIO|nr:hypothetical protein [Deinococcus roseus]GGJ55212.1 hypothetical protein GCM10008938_46690 [Deinococcus roseus]